MMSAGRNLGVLGVVSITVGAAAAWLLMPSAALAQESEITFTRDVAPILQRSCQNCHRPGSIAPMSLLNYREVRPWARSIREKVRTREMPPWYVDKRIGYQRFLADQSLSDDEIATIVQWADNGAPRGNPADMPPPVAFNDELEWVLEEAPDLLAEMPEWHTVKANGPDEKITFAADFLIEEDRWIRAVETKPDAGSFSVVHHSNTSLYHEEEGWNDFPQRVCGGQGPRHLPGGFGPPAPQRRAHHVQRALPLAGRGGPQPVAGRLLALSEGDEAEVRSAHDEGRPERQHRHSGRRRDPARRLLSDAAGRDAAQLPAAYAHPRRPAVPRGYRPGAQGRRQPAEPRRAPG